MTQSGDARVLPMAVRDCLNRHILGHPSPIMLDSITNLLPVDNITPTLQIQHAAPDFIKSQPQSKDVLTYAALNMHCQIDQL